MVASSRKSRLHRSRPAPASHQADDVGEPPLDTGVLAQLANAELGGDPAFVVELIDLFLEQVTSLVSGPGV